MAKSKLSAKFAYPSDLVWSAACAAYRINGGYFKTPLVNEEGKITKPSNRELDTLYITEAGQQFITKEDREQGEFCRKGLLRNVTLTILKKVNQGLSEWDAVTNRTASLETITGLYELYVITALPKSYYQLLERETSDSRLARCDHVPVAPDGTRLELDVEVVRTNYSIKYNRYFVAGITPNNRSVFFAFGKRLPVGNRIKICGRVKRYTGSATQFSRVKLVEQEAV